MRAIACVIILLAAGVAPAAIAPVQAQQARAAEGQAAWKTWGLGSGQQHRVPPPPDRATTDKELGDLARLATARDSAALDRIAYWDTGAPSYRWSEIAVAEHLKNGSNWLVAARNLALMHVAIHDALIAAWDSKYAYNRPRLGAARAGL